MAKTILGVLGLVGIGTICLLVACACLVSNWGNKNE